MMRVIAKRALRDFWMLHPASREPLVAWYDDAHAASWSGPADIKRSYSSASFLRENRVVFNIGGNKYGLVAKVNYPYGVVYVRFVGTHAAYNRIDAETV